MKAGQTVKLVTNKYSENGIHLFGLKRLYGGEATSVALRSLGDVVDLNTLLTMKEFVESVNSGQISGLLNQKDAQIVDFPNVTPMAKALMEEVISGKPAVDKADKPDYKPSSGPQLVVLEPGVQISVNNIPETSPAEQVQENVENAEKIFPDKEEETETEEVTGEIPAETTEAQIVESVEAPVLEEETGWKANKSFQEVQQTIKQSDDTVFLKSVASDEKEKAQLRKMAEKRLKSLKA
jgi:hypothetical protein